MPKSEPATTERKQGRKISKVLLSILVCFVLLECSTRLLFSIDAVRRRVFGPDDSSWRMNWIRLHRAHQEINGQYAVYHPIRGWALQPDITNMSVFEGKILNSNSKGLRGKTEYKYQGTRERQRILVLGDSFTFGDEVSDDETYCHYLEATLPNTEVLNLGVQGYGHDQMLLYLRQEGVKYHPDVVILGFTFLDISRNELSFFGYAKPKFEVKSGSLVLTNVPVPTPERVLAEEPYRLATFDLAVMLQGRLSSRLGIAEARARGLTISILDEIVATIRSINAVPIFVYLPIVSEARDASVPMTERERFLNDYCRHQDIPCLFLRSRFRDDIAKGTQFIARGGHWTAQTHLRAAQEIKEFLLDHSLVQNGSGSAGKRRSPEVVQKSEPENEAGRQSARAVR